MIELMLILIINFHLQPEICKSQIITKGTYFQVEKSTNEDESNGHSGIAVTSEEMLWCSRESSCGEIGRLKNQNKYTNVKKAKKEYDTILKKVKSGFRDCKEPQAEGMNMNGVVEISWKNGSSFRGYCNMVTDSGGWIVIQRRVSNELNFFKNWTDYVNGFGSLDGNFWLGLEAMHQLTIGKKVTLRIDLKNKDGLDGYAKYSNFKVLSSDEKYKLKIGSYIEGNIGDSLSLNNNMKFSTGDNDNDKSNDINCAVRYQGPWWHKGCFIANLNNLFPNEKEIPITNEAPNAAVMSWYTWGQKFGTVTYSEMMLKADD